MKSYCLSFRQIPHTTKLFADFLDYPPQIQQFYSHSARFGDWFQKEAFAMKYDPARRERVAGILERQNRRWGAGPKVLENIARLKAGAAAVVTGQQVGLFGGPLYTIFKALTAVKLADEASQSGVPCIPVFWLATEDHDLAEVNHGFLPGGDASLQRISTATQSVPDAPVGTVKFGLEITDALESATALLGDSHVTTWLRESYQAGETFGSAFARLFVRIFGEWGVILLDASDPELHEIAQPIYRGAIEHAVEFEDALRVRGRELEAAGYHQQVKVAASSTLLFALRGGSRLPVQKQLAGVAPPEFVIAEEVISQQALVHRIVAKPEDFSPNVLLRPVVQDYLLPTLAYTGGPAEVAYFAQAAVLYQKILGRVTPIVPRFSATLLEQKPQVLLERYGVTLQDVLCDPQQLQQVLATRSLPQELQKVFHEAEGNLDKSLGQVRIALENLDRTLVDAAKNAEEKMRYQLSQLRARAGRAELRQTEILGRHATLLSQMLYPNKALQEREVAGVYFLARHGIEFLRDVVQAINPACLHHQVLSW